MTFDPKTYSSLADLRAGKWYLPGHGEVAAQHERITHLLKEFNELANTNRPRADELLGQILAPESSIPEVFGPLHLEYGSHISFGEGCFLNFNTVILDSAEVRFGARTMVGPNCQFITVGHPVHDLEMRRGGWEQAAPITIGADCWFGAGVLVLPGVSVGDRCIIAAGSLVTKDIPQDSLVMGSPARVVRQLNTGADRLEREEMPAGVPVEGFHCES